MGLTDGLAPATSMFSGGFGRIASYAWILIPIAIVIFGFMGVWLYKKYKKMDSQWTHTLKVRRVLQNNLLTDYIIHKMRRFPLIKKAEVFELEKPLLGAYLIPELDEYSGHNEFSIILDKNNRIYTNKGEFFMPDASSVNVSAKHSEIDIQRQNLKANFQNINSVGKRVGWAEILKYGAIIIGIVAIVIVAIVGLQRWGEAQEFKSQEAQATAAMMESLNEAMETMQGTKNTDVLILDKLRDLYGTNNIQSIIRSKTNATLS